MHGIFPSKLFCFSSTALISFVFSQSSPINPFLAPPDKLVNTVEHLAAKEPQNELCEVILMSEFCVYSLLH